MAQRGNPEVREWMKNHKEEVAKVQQRYDELKECNLETLVRLAQSSGVDNNKVKDKLIAAIIAVKDTK